MSTNETHDDFAPCCGGDSKACHEYGPCSIERERRVAPRFRTFDEAYAEGERAATERILDDAELLLRGWYVDTNEGATQAQGIALFIAMLKARTADRRPSTEGEAGA